MYGQDGKRTGIPINMKLTPCGVGFLFGAAARESFRKGNDNQKTE